MRQLLRTLLEQREAQWPLAMPRPSRGGPQWFDANPFIWALRADIVSNRMRDGYATHGADAAVMKAV